MKHDEIWTYIDAERAGLADFLDTLSHDQWSTQSLCPDWTVRDVGAHLTQSTANWLRFGVEAVRSGFRFDRMVSRMARNDCQTPAQITAALRSMIGDRRRPPGTAVADPLMDVLVHGQDIARPLGVTRTMPAAAAVVVAERLWGMTFPLDPSKRYSDTRFVATDVDFSIGTGVPVTGAMADIVLALAGRNVGLAGLSGTIPSAAAGRRTKE